MLISPNVNEKAVNSLLNHLVEQAIYKVSDTEYLTAENTVIDLLRVFNAGKRTQAESEVIAKAYSDTIPLVVVMCPRYSQRFITPFNGEEDLQRLYIENALRYTVPFGQLSCYTPVVKEVTDFKDIRTDIQVFKQLLDDGDYYNATMMLLDRRNAVIGVSFPIDAEVSGFTVNAMTEITPSSHTAGKGAFWDTVEITLYMD